jgi:hypothetical protein
MYSENYSKLKKIGILKCCISEINFTEDKILDL